jgi:hypothetical protein
MGQNKHVTGAKNVEKRAVFTRMSRVGLEGQGRVAFTKRMPDEMEMKLFSGWN